MSTRKMVIIVCLMLFVEMSNGAIAKENLKALPSPDNMMYQYSLDRSEPVYRQWDADFEALLKKDTKDILAYNKQLSEAVISSIGGLPERCPLNAKIVGEPIHQKGYRIERVIFETLPNCHLTGSMYIPDSEAYKPPYPCVVVGTGHVGGQAKAYPQYQKLSALAALNGMAAFCFDAPAQPERTQEYGMSHEGISWSSIPVGRDATLFFLWDCMRSIDYVQSRKDINPDLIGFTGHSGGGNQTGLAMCFDDRVKAAAPCVGFSNWEVTWEKPIYTDAEQQLFGQLAMGFDQMNYWLLRAPDVKIRYVAGLNDAWAIEGLQKGLDCAKRMYRKFDPRFEEYLELFIDPQGHAFNENKRAACIQWLKRWLTGNAELIPEPDDIVVLDGADLLCTPKGDIRDIPNEASIFDFNKEYEENVLEPQRKRLWNTTNAKAIDRLLDKVRKKVGIRTLSQLPAVKLKRTGVAKRDGYRIEKLILYPEDGIYLPALMFVPETVAVKGATLYINNSGKDTEAKLGGRLEKLVKSGQVVLAVDVRGTGETNSIPSQRANMYILNYYGAYRLGLNYVGMRSEDILVSARWLLQQSVVGSSEKLSLIAVGRDVAVPALHAGALESQLFSSVKLEDTITSFSDGVVKNTRPKEPILITVHGALELYDLPNLAKTLGDKLLD